MQDIAQRVERIREYLRQLTPEMQDSLIIKIERGLLRDNPIPGAQLILGELRDQIRNSGRQAPRIGNPSRLFFNPIEPFLVDGAPARSPRGTIARSSLSPIWLWLCRDAVAAEAKAFVNAARRALLADELLVSERLAHDFRTRVVNRVDKLFASSRGEDDARHRLASYMGPPRAFGDLKQIMGIFRAQDELAELSARLPQRIESLEGPTLDNVMALLDPLARANDDRFLRALFLVKSRLALPVQLLRLANKAAHGNQARQIAKTPYILAVAMAVAEIDKLVSLLSSKQVKGEITGSGALIERILLSLRTLRQELNVEEASPWAHSYADLRAEASGLLGLEIEAIPSAIEPVVKPHPSDASLTQMPSEAEIASAEKAITLFGSLWSYSGEFSIGNALHNAAAKLKSAIKQGASDLMARIARLDAAARKIYLLHIAVIVRFATKLFGRGYAATIVKLVENALKNRQ
jgi:hypothetical protein